MVDATGNAKRGPTIIGIDCAKQPSELGVAIGSISRASVVIEDVFLANDDAKLGKRIHNETNQKRLVRYLAERLRPDRNALLAFDAPLGWPDGMRSALERHCAGSKISVSSVCMFRRATDRFVKQETGKLPLSVGADWIAWTAHHALDLLEQIRAESGSEIPIAWAQSPLGQPAAIEVYPATELISRNLKTTGYKGRELEHRTAREGIVDSLRLCVPSICPPEEPRPDAEAGAHAPSPPVRIENLDAFRD